MLPESHLECARLHLHKAAGTNASKKGPMTERPSETSPMPGSEGRHLAPAKAVGRAPFRFSLSPENLAEALATMARERLPTISLPCLEADDLQRLHRSCSRLTYREARPVVGSGERAVMQDFDLTNIIPANCLVRDLARQLEGLAARAVERLSTPLLDSPPLFDDLIVQRYPKGSRGITPHRDHLRYTGLVALMTVSGRARLFTCEDRAGTAAEEVDISPGRLVLMPAPGFAQRGDRPFHFLKDVTRTRISLGLRHDTWAGDEERS